MKSYLFHAVSFFLKILFVSVLLFFVNANSQAQSNMTSTLSKNNFYVDAGGHFAGQASINLERLFYTGEKTAWYARAGLGGAGIIMANGGLGGLGAVTMLTGRGNKHFEMNCGAFIGKESDDNDIFVFPLIDLGYRYQKPEGGFIFRAKLGFLGLGIGLGYAF